jgi:hypothetical protein
MSGRFVVCSGEVAPVSEHRVWKVAVSADGWNGRC